MGGPWRTTVRLLLCMALVGAIPAVWSWSASAAPVGRPTPPKPVVAPTDWLTGPGALAGYLPGSSSVTPGGAFTHTVPLAVPPGRGGMAPDVSMVYSSTGGDGPLGAGWMVTGASSMITRCPREIVPDGTVAGVRFDAGDRFCLDGQRLVVVEGAYGSSGAEYRTEAESFARIESGPASELGPERFTVWSRSGRKRVYQARPMHRQSQDSVTLTHTDVHQLAPNCLSAEPPLCYTPTFHDGSPDVRTTASSPVTIPRAVWVLVDEFDRSGNAMRYTYHPEHAANNEFLVSSIQYTFGPLFRDGHRAVLFDYEPRPDPVSAFENGVRIPLTQRLRAIRMMAPNPSVTAMVREYRLAYLPYGSNQGQSLRSMLNRITECGAAGGCLPAKEFEWEVSKDPTFTDHSVGAVPLDRSAEPEVSPHLKVQDLDRDGIDDLLYSAGGEVAPVLARLGSRNAAGLVQPLSTPVTVSGQGAWPADTGAYQDVDLSRSRPIDLDGDGQLEYVLQNSVRVYNEGTTYEVRVVRWSGTGFVDAPVSLRAGLWHDFADVNGDGLPDYLTALPRVVDGTAHWDQQFVAVQLNEGGPLRAGLFSAPVLSDVNGHCGHRVYDVDGDGRGDLLVERPTESKRTTTRVEYLCGGGQFSDSVHFDDAGVATVRSGVGTVATPEVDSGWRLPFLSAQSRLQYRTHGFIEAPAEVLPMTDVHLNGLYGWSPEPGDFNADGLRDVLLVATGTDRSNLILWNTGQGLQWDGTTVPLTVDELADVRIGDLNRDGRDDIVTFYNYSLLQSAGPDGIDDTHDDEVTNGPVTDDRISVYLSRGDGRFAGSTLITGAGQPQHAPRVGRTFSALGDFNADGYLDIVKNDGQLRLMTQNTPGTDRIVRVRDEGAGWARELIEYSTKWWDTPPPAPGKGGLAPTPFPLVSLRGPMLVVRKFHTRAGMTDSTQPGMSTQYSYADPVAHVRQGILGFGTVISWNADLPTQTVTTYDVRRSADHTGDGIRDGKYFPFGGRPMTSTTVTAILTQQQVAQRPDTAKARVSRTAYHHDFRTFNHDASFAVFGGRTASAEWEQQVSITWVPLGPGTPPQHFGGVATAPPAQSLRSESTATFDDYGNEVHRVSSTAGGVTETVDTRYDLRPDDWLISLSDRVTTTRAEADNDPGPVTRTLDTEFDHRGRIRRLFVEKDNPDPSLRQTTTYEYNLWGTPTRTTLSTPGLPDQVSHTEWDEWYQGQPDEDVFPSQVWSEHTTPVNGQPNPTDYRPSSWQVLHPAYGLSVATMDVNGVRGRTFYDDLNRPTRSTADGAPTVHTAYQRSTGVVGIVLGTVTTVRTETSQPANPALDQVSTVTTDDLGRTRRSTTSGFDGTPVATVTGYDRLGRAVSTTRPFTGPRPHGVSTVELDSLNRPVLAVAADQTRTVTSYPDLFTSRTVDPSGDVAETVVDVNGRTTSSTGHVDGVAVRTRFTYAPFDLRHTMVDERDNATVFGYDTLGRRIRVEDPDRGTTVTTYYGNDLVSSETHEGSQDNTTLTYDDLGRTVARVDTSGGESRTTGFTWDVATRGIGRLASATSPDGITTGYGYDDLGRGTRVSYWDGAVEYRTDTAFDSRGRVDTVTYPSMGGRRLTVRNTYNNHGFVNEVLDVTDPTPRSLYRPTARNADLAMTQATAGGVTVGRGFNSLNGRLETATATVAASGVKVQDLTYTYRPDGLVQTRTQRDLPQPRVETYRYDGLDRLTGWDLTNGAAATVTTRYGIDDIGNLTTVHRNGVLVENRSHGRPDGSAPHALTADSGPTSAGAETYTLDDKGRQRTAATSAGVVRDTLYTVFDLPRKVTDQVTGRVTTFDYDANRTRVRKTTPGQTTFTVPGLFEHRRTGQTSTYVNYLRGPDGPIGQLTHNGTTSKVEYTLTDRLGSTGKAVDATGAVTGTFHYDPYGARINADGTRDTTPNAGTGITHGFAGHEHDDDLRLINMKGRVYDPAAKTFLTADPVLANHPYTYVNSNPTNQIDPTGFSPYPGYSGAGGAPSSGYGGNNGYGTGSGTSQNGNTGSDEGGLIDINAVFESIRESLMPIMQPLLLDPIDGWMAKLSADWDVLQWVMQVELTVAHPDIFSDEPLLTIKAGTAINAAVAVIGVVAFVGDLALGLDALLVAAEREAAMEAMAEAMVLTTEAEGGGLAAGAVDVLADTELPAGATWYNTGPTQLDHYNSVNVFGGTENCQACAIAGDSVLGGEEAVALNVGGEYKANLVEKHFGRPTLVFKPQTGPGILDKAMAVHGEGSTGVVWGMRWNGKAWVDGHTWNARFEGGKAVFYDFQPFEGGIIPEKYMSEYNSFDIYGILMTRSGL